MNPMKNILCLFVLMASAFLVLSGCQSTTSSNSDPIFQPVPEQQPVFTGEYFTEVDTPPTITRGMEIPASPVYPSELKLNKVSGEAVIAFLVMANGQTDQVQVVRATHRGFADAAIAAVKQWHYKPAIKDGKPVNCRMQTPIGFNISDSDF